MYGLTAGATLGEGKLQSCCCIGMIERYSLLRGRTQAMSTATVSAVSVGEKQIVDFLLELSLNSSPTCQVFEAMRALNEQQRAEFLRLADCNHVIIRALEPVLAWATVEGETDLAQWAATAIGNEKARVENCLLYLHAICTELENSGCPTTVMKSLEHYPDIGSDLDLFTTAPEERVKQVMTEKFNAVAEGRSWGDRIANKHNFKVPGLPESVEIHVQRLGQMGEHRQLARRFATRRVTKTVAGRTYYVPAPEERVTVATLQRMYRHFYFRVCDIVNSAALVESGELDLIELKRATSAAGIWSGAASYLQIVSDFVKRFRGRGLSLPAMVTKDAKVFGDDVFVRKDFLRVPILPKGATLYTEQVTKTALNGDVPATFRLGLLPYLASAAAISYKLTGSDKGIW